MVKSDTAAVHIPELDFEVPPSTQKGVVTTLEGVITEAISGLGQEQPARRVSYSQFPWSLLPTGARLCPYVVDLMQNTCLRLL